ncbi:hypothetical protein S7711_09298 [Stachybotrys chartarum IBT 7711]|uniref:DUF4238 domain-containing protein n=1 Tax=Stachybotrys chartarum (strain CBS 109288 / IBT 7711) TaxID=1280523 RepID=A0A084AJM9_STACB|nr:hypothetical protein S7711_09298 [Stachybotrys chartarum IBT 7711]KFA45865.1 hypothetical protein S40293_09343 [Stachybotrys chartarum IBT 40293]
MAATPSQFHHYIPRFILKHFAYTSHNIRTKSSVQDGLLHVFDVSSRQFSLGEVKKTCGTQNLYYDANNTDPMRIEDLFSKLESKTSTMFHKISTAVTEGHDHIDILEKDIHILFKFMMLSIRRSNQSKDEVENSYRENDFLYQKLFEDWNRNGGSGDPGQWWREQLLYLLETAHDGLLEDARQINDTSAADTYKHLVESYALQIWKAADGYEFFLNEDLVDFEGETLSYIGAEVKDTGHQLVQMTTNDLIHLILPINPEVAVVFCDESRCWKSPFADIMHRLKIPYPRDSLLKNAPHQDIININVPSERRGKKTWPATMAWRVNIGMLSREHHVIITSYSLVHAKSLIIVRRRARFERARREFEGFWEKRNELLKSQGIRLPLLRATRKHNEDDNLSPPSPQQVTRMVNLHISALDEVLNKINNTNEPLPRTKDNALTSWLALRVLESHRLKYLSPASIRLGSNPSSFDIMHPVLKAAFEAAYGPQQPDHRKLNNVEFAEFVCDGLGEEKFSQLTSEISSKISEMVSADSFHAHWEAFAKSQPPETSVVQVDENVAEESARFVEDLGENAAFKSVYKMAQEFDVLSWMFHERQDILATFIRQIAVTHEDMAPHLTRFRMRRE